MSTIGTKIDALFALDQKIDAAEKVVRKLKTDRAKQEGLLIRKFKSAELDGAKGSKCLANVKEQRFPSIKDRKKFWKFVASNKAYDLVQNRISSTAYFDRLEEGVKVPGVEVFKRVSISLRKRK